VDFDRSLTRTVNRVRVAINDSASSPRYVETIPKRGYRFVAPVTRLEIGGGYSIQRNLVFKVSYQHNTREGGRVRALNLPAAQMVFWF
jgi:DNA-binding winged helix-turn-helix (wHTH) protein